MSRRVPLAVFYLVAAGLLAVGIYLDRATRAEARARGAAELDAVAQLKVNRLVDYRADLARLAHSYGNSLLFAGVVQGGPSWLTAVRRSELERQLDHELALHGHASMAVLGVDGREVVSRRTPGAPALPQDATLVAAALAGGGVGVSALRADPVEGLARIDVASAVRPAEGAPVGVVYFQVDLTALLEDLSRAWPVPNRSGEAVLVRRDGDAVLFITEPRGRTGWRMRERAPLTERHRGLVQAGLGRTGVFEALDYRNVPILVAARPVPDSDWILITRLDLAEIEAPVARTIAVGAFTLTALLLGAAAALILWFRREDRQRLELAAAARALEKGEARLRLALAGNAFVWEWDLEQGRLEADAEWGRILGMESSLVTGDLPAILGQVVAEADRGEVLAAFEAHFSGRSPLVEAEFRAPGAAGEVRWVSIRGRVYERGPTGQPRRAMGVVADVTARRRVQEQLERSERLLSLGTLAAGVAHEINNPLTYVLDAVGRLADDLPAALPGRPDLVEAAGHARDGAQRVREVVRRLRAFSRPASGRRGPVDVGQEVAAAIRLAGNELHHLAKVEARYGPAPLVVASEHQLGQVFVNLLLNAAHAVEAAGGPDRRVAVEVGTDPAGWARVEVRDSGTGIPAGILPHIFEPFFTTRGQGSGTGLGLAICWAEVGAAGGRIEVETEEGRGSTFRVLLPPAPPGTTLEAAAPSVAAPAAPGGAAPTVLVVDDDPLVARSIQRALGKGFDVVMAGGGREALRLLAGRRFDAVVCDLMMPGMSGIELHGGVAAADPDQARRFVFVTGGAFTEAARAFLESSAAPRVEKPFDPAQLRLVVEAVARGGPASAEPSTPATSEA